MTTLRLEAQFETPYMVANENPRAALERFRDQYKQLILDLSSQMLETEKQRAAAEVDLRRIESALAALAESDLPVDHRPLTIKEGVIKILSRVAPRGLTALSILERLRTELNMSYPRSSLSPQLSRLKSDGFIRLERGQWFLANKENGSGAKAPEPS